MLKEFPDKMELLKHKDTVDLTGLPDRELHVLLGMWILLVTLC